MKVLKIFILVFISCVHFIMAQNAWKYVVGGSDYETAFQTIQTADGAFYTIGGSASFGQNNTLMLTKTSAAGQYEWSKIYFSNTISNGIGFTICESNDKKLVMAGWCATPDGRGQDILICKVDTSGNIIWSNHYGSMKNEFAYNMKLTNDGGYIITGGAYPTDSANRRAPTKFWDIDHNTLNSQGILVLKIDSTGHEQWCHIYGNMQHLCYGSAVIEDDDHNYIVAGGSEIYGGVGYYMAILKIDNTGNVIWRKNYGGGSQDSYYGQDILQFGPNYYIAGKAVSTQRTTLDTNICAMKIDKQGNIRWAQIIGDQNFNVRAMTNNNGSMVITGHTKSFSSTSNIFLLDVDTTDGSASKFITMDAGVWDFAYGIIPTNDGGLLLTGASEEGAAGNTDYLLYKLNANEIPCDSVTSRTLSTSSFVPNIVSTTDSIATIMYKDTIAFNITNSIIAITNKLCPGSAGILNHLFDVKEISITPDPSNGIFTVNYQSTIVSAICISDFTGREIKKIIVNDISGEGHISLDISGAASGIYFVRVYTPGGIVNKKLILQ